MTHPLFPVVVKCSLPKAVQFATSTGGFVRLKSISGVMIIITQERFPQRYRWLERLIAANHIHVDIYMDVTKEGNRRLSTQSPSGWLQDNINQIYKIVAVTK